MSLVISAAEIIEVMSEFFDWTTVAAVMQKWTEINHAVSKYGSAVKCRDSIE